MDSKPFSPHDFCSSEVFLTLNTKEQEKIRQACNWLNRANEEQRDAIRLYGRYRWDLGRQQWLQSWFDNSWNWLLGKVVQRQNSTKIDREVPLGNLYTNNMIKKIWTGVCNICGVLHSGSSPGKVYCRVPMCSGTCSLWASMDAETAPPSIELTGSATEVLTNVQD